VPKLKIYSKSSSESAALSEGLKALFSQLRLGNGLVRAMPTLGEL
jgi:hypothetical protein